MQKILILTTTKESLRADIESWGNIEDGDNVGRAYSERVGTKYHYDHQNLVPVGLIKSSHSKLYSTVLHAMGDGWRLMAPPQKDQQYSANQLNTFYYWWLTKD